MIIDRGVKVVAGTGAELKSALRGETLRVELYEPSAEVVRGALTSVPALRDVVVEATGTSGAIVARTDDASAALPRVIAALGAAGVAFGAASVSGPTLDDVYLHHVGHSFGAGASAADATADTLTEGEAA
jgi:ABC-2 type transport system ATP-binding protein